MYLDNTYFTGNLYIPNLVYRSGAGAVIQAVNEYSLNWFIEKYEEEFLIELLGRNLYNEMTTGVDNGEEKWIALRDKIYRVGDVSFSPAANYVYFNAMRDFQTQTSMNGEVRGKNTHSSIVPAYDKLVRVWNDMVKMCRDISDFMIENDYGRPQLNWVTINKFGL